MCKKNFDKILSAKKGEERGRLEGALKAAFRPLSEPESILEIGDEIERNIKFAIDLASQEPFKTIILTTDEKNGKYKDNSHFRDASNISIKSDEDAIALIDFYHQQTLLT
jgi:hypothetical protein